MKNNNIKELLSAFQTFVFENELRLEKVAADLKVVPATIAKILNEQTTCPHPRTRYKIKKYLEENGVSVDA